MNESSQRGMVKWAPYKSLIEQAPILARMRYEKNKKPRPWISQDRAAEINEVLVAYHQEEVDANYYEDGYLYDIRGIIDVIPLYINSLKSRGNGYPSRTSLTSKGYEKRPVGALIKSFRLSHD